MDLYFKARIKPTHSSSYPWGTYIENNGGMFAYDTHSTWFFARCRFRKLKRRVVVLNREHQV